jgi:hypothetical protein
MDATGTYRATAACGRAGKSLRKGRKKKDVRSRLEEALQYLRLPPILAGHEEVTAGNRSV